MLASALRAAPAMNCTRTLLISPSVCLSTMLLMAFIGELTLGPTKEMVAEAAARDVPREYVDQWKVEHYERLRSETITTGILATSLWLLYASRMGENRTSASSVVVVPPENDFRAVKSGPHESESRGLEKP